MSDLHIDGDKLLLTNDDGKTAIIDHVTCNFKIFSEEKKAEYTITFRDDSIEDLKGLEYICKTIQQILKHNGYNIDLIGLE